MLGIRFREIATLKYCPKNSQLKLTVIYTIPTVLHSRVSHSQIEFRLHNKIQHSHTSKNTLDRGMRWLQYNLMYFKIWFTKILRVSHPSTVERSKRWQTSFSKIHSLHERKVKINDPLVFILLLLTLLPPEESCLAIAMIRKSLT